MTEELKDIEEDERAAQERQRENKRIYEKMREEVIAIKLSNQQAYDKTIISLSGAIVAASIGVFTVKNMVVSGWLAVLLGASWFFFAGAIVLVLRSLHMGNKASDAWLVWLEQYYLYDMDESASSIEGEELVKKTSKLNVMAGVFFATGVILTILFATSKLLPQGESSMTDSTRFTEGATPSSNMVKKIQDGATPSTMQKKGLTPSVVQPKTSGSSGTSK